MEYVKVKPLENQIINDFVTDNNLFAVFDETPVNIIFLDNFINNIKLFKDIFVRFNMHDNIFFSCKANKSYALLKTAAKQKCGIEVASYYELVDALKYTKRIIASGPAKDYKYLNCAIENGVIISVDDIEELKDIKRIGKKTKVLLRLSDILGITSRFGINISQIDECLKTIEKSKIKLIGFSFHINNYNLNDRVKAIMQILDIVNNKQININYIDIGGGLPVNYCTKEDFNNFLEKNNKKMYFKEKNIKDFYPYFNELATNDALEYILDKVKNRLGKIEIMIEPGRSLLDNCGISIYDIKYLKHLNNGDNLIITNGNINCLSEQWFNTDYLVEPKLYKKTESKNIKENFLASVAGNLCLEQDIITWRKINFEQEPERGDYLIYYNTAGYQMDSNESNFHKIPLVEKFVVKKVGKGYKIRSDNSYGCK